jgi:hypothetical protein
MTLREVRLADELAPGSNLLEDRVYEDCLILGPAVLGLVDTWELTDCTFSGPWEEVFWVAPEKAIQGPIALRNVAFRRCTFAPHIGIIGPQEVIEQVGRDLLA